MSTGESRTQKAGKHRRRYLPAAERKKEILHAAFVEFSDQGYTAATMETIAVRAGLSKAGIYAHYKSKEEIFEDLLMTMLPPRDTEDVSFDADLPLDAIVDAYLDSLYPSLAEPITLATFRLLVMESRRIAPDLVQRWYRRVVEGRLLRERAFLEECGKRGIIRGTLLTESGFTIGSPLPYWICLYLLFGENVPVSLQQVRGEHKRVLLELLAPK